MITNYYTLRALVHEWRARLAGCIVGDVYSQTRDELTIAFASKETTWMVRANVRAPFQYLFLNEGYNKARRNVATLMTGAFDQPVEHTRLAHRDRILYIELGNQKTLQFLLFGPRANVLLVDQNGFILDAFQRREALIETRAPAPRPAPWVTSFDAFKDSWSSNRKTITKAISASFPFFDAILAREVLHRAGVAPGRPDRCTTDELYSLFETATALSEELTAPIPRIYWNNERVEAYSLTFINAFSTYREERFDSVDEAVRVFVRRRLGQTAFEEVYRPLEKALLTAIEKDELRLDSMIQALSEESRADKYERWAHLLMASQHQIPSHADFVELDDLFQDEQRVRIPLDPTLSGIENAERFYEKARNTRLARTHAEDRLADIEKRIETAKELLDQLRALNTASDVKKFERSMKDDLMPFLGQSTAATAEQIPFRRYTLESGYEVWVGKNARQNDELTFKYARKFDYWLHARGVPGSHAILRRPGRTSQPQKITLERAAAIAAFHSKARGSGLVPVIIAERKFVRKPRGAPPGAVLVDREEVLLVEPALPS